MGPMRFRTKLVVWGVGRGGKVLGEPFWEPDGTNRISHILGGGVWGRDGGEWGAKIVAPSGRSSVEIGINSNDFAAELATEEAA